MMYGFLALSDNTEIVHSDLHQDGTVEVYIETPDEKDGFHHATCLLPSYKWYDISGFSQEKINYFNKLIKANSHIIILLSGN